MNEVKRSIPPNPKKIMTDQRRIEKKEKNETEKTSLYFETTGGNKLVIRDCGQGLSIEDSNGNRIIMNGEGISIESVGSLTIKADIDIRIEANHIDIKSMDSFRAHGSASAEMSTSATATVKGAMVQINGQIFSPR
jgi:hypothetical protein